MKLSWEERLRRMGRAGTDDRPLSGETLSGFYEGVGLLAKKKYPEWLSKRLIEVYSAPVNLPFVQMVAHADKLIELDPDGIDPEIDNGGYELMYQLLIEPFYLIDEKDQEREERSK